MLMTKRALTCLGVALTIWSCADADPCTVLGGCIEDAGLVVAAPEIDWARARRQWAPGELRLGPGDTVPILVRIENHADTFSPAGRLDVSTAMGTLQQSFLGLAPKSARVFELTYRVPAFTFQTADTLRPTVVLDDVHGLNGTLVEGNSVLALVGRGFEIRLVQAPAALRTGVPATARVRIVNPFELPLPADSIIGCLWHVDYCPAEFPTTPTPALLPGDSAEFDVDVTPPVFQFHWWFERLESVYLIECWQRVHGDYCATVPMTVLPNFELTCPPQGTISVPTTITDTTPDCNTLGNVPGSLYTFNAVAGTRYRAERTAGEGAVALSDEDGVTFNAPQNVFEFTAPATGQYYLIIRHTGSITVQLTALP